MKRTSGKDRSRRLIISVLFLFMALGSIGAVTMAWFSISDSTRLQNMALEVTSGVSMRFDLDAHETFEEYRQTLSFNDISARILRDKGFDMKSTPLEPVTTTDATVFTLESGSVVSSTEGKYLEFTLHFMSISDAIVHLTSCEGDIGQLIISETPGLPEAMRIAFTVDGQTCIYDSQMQGSTVNKNVKTFGLVSKEPLATDDDNALFFAPAFTDVPVLVHIWIEGTDEACTNDLKEADYSVQMRFECSEPVSESQNR